ncbi:hypothetical protein V5799_011277 [Amblyomma americanum]|uniref:Serpin domain-containing protein n=1 Tax=Amblyomma americanum TaxID=6943 RepID=A0AAQ4EHK1_AMBAM
MYTENTFKILDEYLVTLTKFYNSTVVPRRLSRASALVFVWAEPVDAHSRPAGVLPKQDPVGSINMSSDLTAGLSAFTVDLYKVLLSGNSHQNIVVSPFSIAAALSMTLAGARERTASEIAAVLHTKDDLIHKQFAEFFSKALTYSSDVTLEVANRLYVEKTFSIFKEYLAILNDCYNSIVMPVNFASEAEAARLAINAWVEEATKSKIKDLLPSGCLDSDTRLVLINAIYFKGLWNQKFNPDATTLRKFHVSKQMIKEIHMMHKQSKFKIAECNDLNVNAVEIPYKGDRTSMVILLPGEIDGLEKLEAALTPSKLSVILEGLRSTAVDLSLPRFKVEHNVNLMTVLQSMGVRKLFAHEADLSGISGKKDLVVSAAFHKAFVEVNEEGTEAAAATALLIRKKMCLNITSPFPFVVDHPFMFFIRSHDPDVILFAGSVRDIQ